MARREREILEHAVHAVAEQAVKANELVDEAKAAGGGDHPVSVHAKMLRLEGEGRPRGGWLLVEVVDFRAREVAAMFRRAGFRGVRHLRAEGDVDRVIAGRMPDVV